MSEPPRLDYRNPRDERSGGWLVLQAIVACGLTCGVVIGGVFFAVMLAWGRGANVLWLFAAAGLPLLGFAVYIALRTGKRPDRRGWAIGIWLGFGLAGLFEGLCFSGVLF